MAPRRTNTIGRLDEHDDTLKQLDKDLDDLTDQHSERLGVLEQRESHQYNRRLQAEVEICGRLDKIESRENHAINRHQKLAVEVEHISKTGREVINDLMRYTETASQLTKNFCELDEKVGAEIDTLKLTRPSHDKVERDVARLLREHYAERREARVKAFGFVLLASAFIMVGVFFGKAMAS